MKVIRAVQKHAWLLVALLHVVFLVTLHGWQRMAPLVASFCFGFCYKSSLSSPPSEN